MGMPYWICRRRRRGEALQLAGVAGWNKTVSREKENWRGRSMLSPGDGARWDRGDNSCCAAEQGMRFGIAFGELLERWLSAEAYLHLWSMSIKDDFTNSLLLICTLIFAKMN